MVRYSIADEDLDQVVHLVRVSHGAVRRCVIQPSHCAGRCKLMMLVGSAGTPSEIQTAVTSYRHGEPSLPKGHTDDNLRFRDLRGAWDSKQALFSARCVSAKFHSPVALTKRESK